MDSDEPQHLHVVWNWSQGRVAYRDFFDNHTPLFHLLMAPLLCLLGERADILNVMRLFVIPFYLVSIWAVHRLANPGKVPVVLIEVQTGAYLGEDDIIRYEDIYARGDEKGSAR